ncbi:MAG: hypothetical protein ACLRRQ_12215 [Lachnospira pectinoschiza]
MKNQDEAGSTITVPDGVDAGAADEGTGKSGDENCVTNIIGKKTIKV